MSLMTVSLPRSILALPIVWLMEVKMLFNAVELLAVI